MRKFLCYDTNDAASGKINVNSNGVLSPNATVPSTNGTAYQQLVTDGEGNVKWEDRLAYSESRICVSTPEASDASEYIKVSDDFPTGSYDIGTRIYIIDSDGDDYEETIRVSNGEVITDYIHDPNVIVALHDNVTFLSEDNWSITLPEKGTYFAKYDSYFITGVVLGDSNEPEITWDGSVFINKKIEKKYIPKLPQPDWNQNDESAVDYIKNKPFHEETTEETILGEYTGELSGLKPSSNLVYGDKYVIYLDGVRYDTECTEDSDVNYILYVDTEHGWINIRDNCWEIQTNITGIHTLKVVHNKIDLYKIDSKFIDFPVTSVNGKTGYVRITASDVGAATTSQINGKMNKSNPVGTGSFSMGRKSGTTIGGSSHAEGYNTTASGNTSHAEGSQTTASSYYSHAEGQNTTASGSASHAEGQNTTASGGASHAEGDVTTASGNTSHAEGYFTKASNDYSHAEGYQTTASGYHSHAEGQNTTASGSASHAEGRVTTASGGAQHVQGKYNIIDTSSKYAHIVGNGTDTKNYSNAHTLDWNGVPWFQGRPQFGGTAQDDGSQTVMANGDSEIILTSTGGKKFSITVDDSGALTATEITT